MDSTEVFSMVSEMMLQSRDYNVDQDIIQRQDDEAPQMYVMTNVTKVNGAVGLLEGSKLAEFAERINSDLYILPSSVNELIIVPQKSMGYDAEKLLEMVKEVNATSVSREEFLADNVYAFKRKEKSLEIALTGEKMLLEVA